MCCLIRKEEENIKSVQAEESQKLSYMKQVLRLFADATEEDCAPGLSLELKKMFQTYFSMPATDYAPIKQEFNQWMLRQLPDISRQVRAAQDPLAAALLCARAANYIDFAAFKDVDQGRLSALLNDAQGEPLDPKEYNRFLKELSEAASLVYLLDNCGEIVLDRLVIEILKERFPKLQITAVVRGEPVINDVTMEDARQCGLTELVPVIANGSGIGGTWLSDINEETRSLLVHADVILSKGQGNFETLHDCGMNIYYLFLCKCSKFEERFHAHNCQGMFLNERRI
jgi:uncharacterized protein with ATP-grasp and redox domains